MVTPRVEASPDRSDFAKLGETTKQLAGDIRSQVASRELAEMNERLMALGFAPGRARVVTRVSFGRPKKALHGLPCPPQMLMIADLAPIDHDPHRLAVTVYHHEVEGRREGVILEGLRQRVRVDPSLNRSARTPPFGLTAQRMQGCFIPISMQWLNAF